jgi:hypothetical protein
VIPTGYSFNLDGTNIYMTLAFLFLAQATNAPPTVGQELGFLAVAMLTSKGAAAFTGAGFVTLAATLTIVPAIPIQALAILVGIDKFMSECRALTNLVGNGIATIVISRLEGELDGARLDAVMRGPHRLGAALEQTSAYRRVRRPSIRASAMCTAQYNIPSGVKPPHGPIWASATCPRIGSGSRSSFSTGQSTTRRPMAAARKSR